MLRDALVLVDRTPQNAQRLDLACDLAARHDAHLTLLHVRDEIRDDDLFRAAELGLMPADALERLKADIAARQQAELDELRSGLDAVTIARRIGATFVTTVGVVEDVACQHARHADLTIIGHSATETGETPHGYTIGEAILFATGRPVLLLPSPTGTGTLGRHVAVAWNGSRPAARALADALPIIQRAEALDVLTAHPIQAPTPSALPSESILDHLRRHNGNVRLHALNLEHRAIAEGLQSEALRLGADLLVAGAYGHPRLWERLLGGVTRDFLSTIRLPLLMAH